MSVSRTVSEIFSIKEWRDLETAGRDRSRSLEMASFDTIYDFLLVRHSIYCSIWYRFCPTWRWKNIVTLKSALKVTEGHSNLYHSKDWVRFPIRLP